MARQEWGREMEKGRRLGKSASPPVFTNNIVYVIKAATREDLVCSTIKKWHMCVVLDVVITLV